MPQSESAAKTKSSLKINDYDLPMTEKTSGKTNIMEKRRKICKWFDSKRGCKIHHYGTF